MPFTDWYRRKEKKPMKWIKVSDRCPTESGEYIICWAYDGLVSTMNFTTIAGWNTHIDSDGELHADKALRDETVYAWMPFPVAPNSLFEEKAKKARMDCPSEEW